MRCPNCWREAAESAVFCNQCGTQLQNICDNCNTLNPLDSNFCSRCGLSSSFELQEAEVPVYQKPQVSSPILSTACPRCHKINEPGSAYCYSCGLPLDEASDTPRQPQRYAQTSAEVQFQNEACVEQTASFGIRLLAGLIDSTVIISVAFILVAFILRGFLPESYSGSPFWGGVFWLHTIYSALFVSLWAATIGKLILRLRVSRTDGSKVGFGRALARSLCYFLSSYFTLGIGFLMIAFRQDNRGLHDLICDTMVIKR